MGGWRRVGSEDVLMGLLERERGRASSDGATRPKSCQGPLRVETSRGWCRALPGKAAEPCDRLCCCANTFSPLVPWGFGPRESAPSWQSAHAFASSPGPVVPLFLAAPAPAIAAPPFLRLGASRSLRTRDVTRSGRLPNRVCKVACICPSNPLRTAFSRVGACLRRF